MVLGSNVHMCANPVSMSFGIPIVSLGYLTICVIVTALLNMNGNFLPHVSAESPSNISSNRSEVSELKIPDILGGWNPNIFITKF